LTVVNGKRPLVTTQPTAATEESYTLAHEENVRFVYESKRCRGISVLGILRGCNVAERMQGCLSARGSRGL
uniref:Uncharacterized protein n=1 Tax=Gopherus evgoodei TaxID=1825980 RepID=A0A8C4VY77_9SAUR